jgi:hypothetical protein
MSARQRNDRSKLESRLVMLEMSRELVFMGMESESTDA